MHIYIYIHTYLLYLYILCVCIYIYICIYTYIYIYTHIHTFIDRYTQLQVGLSDDAVRAVEGDDLRVLPGVSAGPYYYCYYYYYYMCILYTNYSICTHHMYTLIIVYTHYMYVLYTHVYYHMYICWACSAASSGAGPLLCVFILLYLVILLS